MEGSSPYHRMSIAQKQAHHRDRMREPAVVCPRCETQTTAADLLEHMQNRCTGRRAPSPHSKWVSWRQALALGVAPKTLSRWAQRGWVRAVGEEPQCRLYLARDIVVRLAHQRANRRR